MRELPTTETLFRQASMTVHTYFHEAIEIIDKRFGENYAEAHPELIGALVHACALDFHTGILMRTITETSQQITEALDHE
jgi:precorrin isomerase